MVLGGRDILMEIDLTEIDAFSKKIVNVSSPTNPQDVVTKAYGDANYGGVGGGDDLGSHIATQDLDLDNFTIFDVDQIQITGSTGNTIRGFFSSLAGEFKINSDENSSEIDFNTRDAGGTLTTKLIVDENTITANNPLVFGEVDALGNTENGIGVNSSGVVEVNAVTRIELAIGGTGRWSMANTAWGGQTGDDFRLFCVSSGNKAPINLEPVAGDPTTVENGDIWYNNTTGKFRCREGGVSKNLI